MAPRLKFVNVENFRSIHGSIGVSLDAPAVLIHGPNGTGKTSLLSAIELGLTGSVGSMARFDKDYLAHLPHKRAPDGIGRITLSADGVGEGSKANLAFDGATISGAALLGEQTARFYTERCYLPQATLGQLLEIYEHQDTRKSDSPLTRFVKEMLGLQTLDALIDGLHTAGDVRRFRESAPSFWTKRADAPKLDKAVEEARTLHQSLLGTLNAAEANLREQTGPLTPNNSALNQPALHLLFKQRIAESEQRLDRLSRMRRDLSGASGQVDEALASDAEGERARTEAASRKTREELLAWQAGSGAEIDALVAAIQVKFPEVPPAASNPALAHGAATAAVKAARQRNQAATKADDDGVKRLGDIQGSVRQAQGRIVQIDRELSSTHGANRKLAEALSAISGHIEEEECPVCNRNFSEMSAGPLAAHVSEKIARLVTAAGRVEALVRDRSSTATSLAAAERQAADLTAKQLSAEKRAALMVEEAELGEWENSLALLVVQADQGSRRLREAIQDAQRLSMLNSRQTSIGGLRAELATYVEALAMPAFLSDTPLPAILAAVSTELDSRAERETAFKASGQQSLIALDELARAREQLGVAEEKMVALEKRQQRSAADRAQSEHTISVARDLAARAQAVRGDEVRRVFNEELNSIWRELFVRLAPEEAFVPAFAVPEVAGRPVEAVLETLYRAGGKGGNPRAMLSAGNLNTAALTLFLALHLSVPPALPWLVIDDPVQSMDDVHIAQFAALLRTLKQHGRQVVIAVHNRQLFDYLALELSPAFNGDRLVTIELGRNADGLTVAPWTLTAFEPDRAIAA